MAGILDLLAQPPVPQIDYSPPGVLPRNLAPGLLEAMIASASSGEASLSRPNQPSLIESFTTPIDVQALYDARRNHPGYWETYNPTKREWIGDRVYDAGRMMGFNKSRAHRFRSDVGAVLDFVPGFSSLLAGEDVGLAYNDGDYPGMAMAALGAVPGGRLVGKAKKSLVDEAGRAGKGLNNLESRPAHIYDHPDAVPPAVQRVSQYQTEHDLVQSIADRVEAQGDRKGWGAYGTGPNQGIKKHNGSKDMLERYQSMTGRFKHLLAEYSRLSGEYASTGTLGSSKADVFSDPVMGGSGTIFDYKFTKRPPSVGARQMAKYTINFPGSRVVPIGPSSHK